MLYIHLSFSSNGSIISPSQLFNRLQARVLVVRCETCLTNKFLALVKLALVFTVLPVLCLLFSVFIDRSTNNLLDHCHFNALVLSYAAGY